MDAAPLYGGCGIMTKLLSLISLYIFSVLAVSTHGQTIPLRLDATKASSVFRQLFCDERYNCGLTADDIAKQDKLSGYVIRVQRDGSDFLISVRIDRRKGNKGGQRIRLKNGTNAIIKIRQQVTQRRFHYFPYEVSHERIDEKGKVVDSFNLRAHYLMAAKFRSSNCSMNIALNDINTDGKVNLRDGESGSNFQIDRNMDGKFWGKGEFSSTNEIIEICSQNYLVSSLGHSRLVLKPTPLKLAKIGEKVANFTFDLINGTRVSAESMLGRSYIMDFWASWCVPCIENLPDVLKLRDDLKGSIEVFSLNVDRASKRSLVERIIQQNKMVEFSTIRGLGDEDSVWKVFGGANSNRLAIPLYVLVDGAGIMRYAANGGENLVDLKKAVNDALRR
jgi:thiol-disulfide isomerase/thioredoxin